MTPLAAPFASLPGAPDERVMGLIVRLSDVIEKRIDASLEAVDLSLPKFSALKHLALAGEPLPLSELAARMICVRSNITQLVDRLEADGLVCRVVDPKDRRSVRASLTPLGRERQAAGALRMEAVRAEMAEKLRELDCDALDRALSRLR
jgi:DNA-binding MarR family transcriptional regulator